MRPARAPGRGARPLKAFRVLDPGSFATLQDLGRPGHRAAGIAAAGAFDAFALRAGNRLAGNPPGAAGLEIALTGPRLEALAPLRVAVTGADFAPMIGGAPLPAWRTAAVPAGAVLAFGRRRSGCRVYLAVGGGLLGPAFLGSRSTDGRSGLGGFRLAAGQVLEAGPAPVATELDLARRAAPVYEPAGVARVLPGPEADWFPAGAWAAFLAAAWTVDPASDRAGVRLDGPAIPHRGGDLLSAPVLCGDVQVPPDGRPIVLGPECQSVGGYPRIARVIAADVPKLAQAGLGERVRFAATDWAEAVAFASLQRAILEA